MCDSSDIIQSSYRSASAMTSSFCNYGEGNMGDGIRKFAENTYSTGLGNGYSLGFTEGVIATIVSVGAVGLCAWSTKRIISRLRRKNSKEVLMPDNDEVREESYYVEVQSNVCRRI